MEVSELKTIIQTKEVSIVSLQETIAGNHKSIAKTEQTVKEQKVVIDKIIKDYEVVNAKYTKLQDDYDASNYNLEKAKKQFYKLANELKVNAFFS